MEQLNKLSGFVHWLPRLSLAATFFYHGWPKFGSAEMMATGMGMPVFMIYMLATMEVAGGVLIILGGFGPDWATRIAGLFFSIVMVGAISKFHFQNGWNSINMGGGNEGKGWEFQALILAVALVFLIKGKAVNRAAGDS